MTVKIRTCIATAIGCIVVGALVVAHQSKRAAQVTPARGCASGQFEIEPCGQCNGTRQRTCVANQWGAWSSCRSEYLHAEGGYPVCGAFTDPAVFFSPHPDDETIGMGAAIIEHLMAGRTTIIEMLTDGNASSVINVLNGTDIDLETGKARPCGWHLLVHQLALTPQQFVEGRRLETNDAIRRLGNDVIVHYNHRGDGGLEKANVDALVRYWRSRTDGRIDKGTRGPSGTPMLSLKGTGGYPDDTAYHADHQAVWDALVESKFSDIRGYLVNYYGSDKTTPASPVGVAAGICRQKQWALEAFKVWEPTSGRYGIGNHSAGNLIQGAMACMEYLVKR